eukprot:gene7747-15846_t
MASLTELRQLLKQDADGKNLYEHLTETLMKILLDKPKNAYDMFELISAEVKANPLNPEQDTAKKTPASPDEIWKQLEWAKACSALLKTPDEPPDVNVKFPDLMDESNLWEWAGISFGKTDTYRLYLSIKKFSESLPGDVERLRLFGKINTRTTPYFVVEGLSAEEEDDLDPMKKEGRNGANKYTYWVTQNFESGNWIQLPNVTAEQVVISRKFKRFLTGNLDADIPSYPPFPGKERDLLRAQIARICGETSVSPAGYFELDEEEDPPVTKLAEAETINENFPKTPAELKDADAWNHHEIELNALGRATALPEQLDDNGDPIEVEDPVEPTPPLKGIETEAWAFRICPGGAGDAPFSLVVARSLIWPGAVAIAAGKRFLNIYVGNGIMYEAQTYTPPLPSAVQKEWMPVEEDDALVEAEDAKVDPTPPEPENEEEEED